jgi:hypothetical protein
MKKSSKRLKAVQENIRRSSWNTAVARDLPDAEVIARQSYELGWDSVGPSGARTVF